MKTSLLVLFISFSAIQLWSQCSLKIEATPKISRCGDTVTLQAKGYSKPVFGINFNEGLLSDLDNTCKGGVVTDGTGKNSCSGNAPEGSHYFWMNPEIGSNRFFKTRVFDLSNLDSNNSIRFWLNLNVQGENSPCEGIDWLNEGIHFQYSIDNGLTWKEITYYHTLDYPELERWQLLSVPLPQLACTNNTQFRWFQLTSSGAIFDSWGLDDFQITGKVFNATFDWFHDNLPPSTVASTIKVTPQKSTYYTLEFNNGTSTCRDSVLVLFSDGQNTIDSVEINYCKGDSIALFLDKNKLFNFPEVSGLIDAPFAENSFISENIKKFSTTTNLETDPYASFNNSILGNFGSAYQTTQLLFRASELKNSGITEGIIEKIGVEVQRIVNPGNTYNSVDYPNFSIEIGTSKGDVLTRFENTESVFFKDKLKIILGENIIAFDKPYYWDGTSNLIVQFCFYYPNQESSSYNNSIYALLNYERSTYNCSVTSSTNFSGGACGRTDFVSFETLRPQLTFYTKTFNENEYDFTWKDEQQAILSNNSTFKLKPKKEKSIYLTLDKKNSANNCPLNFKYKLNTLNPSVQFALDTIFTTANADSIRLKPNVAVQQFGLSKKSFIKDENPNISIPIIDSIGKTSTITVTGYPNKDLSIISLSALELSLMTGYLSDDYIEVTAPNGSKALLFNYPNLNGSNLTKIRFTDSTNAQIFTQSVAPFSGSFKPLNPLNSLTGPVNGDWKLRIVDLKKIGIIESASTFDKWSLHFTEKDKTIHYQWSPTELCTPSDTNFTQIKPSSTQTFYVTVTDPKGCATTDSVYVQLNTSDTLSSIFDLAYIICEDTPFDLPTISQNGIQGTWNPIPPTSLKAGKYSFLFTPNTGQKGYKTRYTVVVQPKQPVAFELNTLYCKGESTDYLPMLSLNEIQGNWSPSIISSTDNGSYTFTPDPTLGQCATDTVLRVSIEIPKPSTFDTIAAFCAGTIAPTLKPQSKEGIFGTWSPAVVSNSTSKTYTFTPKDVFCVNSTTLSIQVKPSKTLIFDPINTTYCENSTPESLPSKSNNGINGTWTPNQINTTISGDYLFKADSGICANEHKLHIDVKKNIKLNFTPFEVYCINDDFTYSLPDSSNEGVYVYWIPRNIDESKTAYYTYFGETNECVISDSILFEVEYPINLTFPFEQFITYCVGEKPIILPETSDNGITGDWSPAKINTDSSSYIEYTFKPSIGNCYQNTLLIVTVKDTLLSTFNFPDSLHYCLNSNPISLTTTTQEDIFGTWNPDMINTSVVGTSYYTFTADKEFWCSPDVQLKVVVDGCQNTEKLEKNIFSIYPNPNFGTFTVSTDVGILKYRLIDLSGKTIKEKTIGNPVELKQEIEINQVVSGSYILELTLTDQTVRNERIQLISKD